MKKLSILISTILIVVLLSLSCSKSTPVPVPTAAPSAKPAPVPSPTATAAKMTQLNMGSTTSTSGVFVYAVAAARVINKYAPQLNVTVIESGGGYDNINRIRDGAFDFATSCVTRHIWEMYNGVDVYKDKSWKEIRTNFIQEQGVLRIYVRQDSGIKSWSDLKGKKFAPGIPGSGAALYAVKLNDTLNTGVDIWMSSLADALDAISAGRAVGVIKYGPVTSYDSGLLQTHLRTPLVPLTLSEADLKTMIAQNPHYDYRVTPKGTIKEAPDFTGYEMYQVNCTAMPTSVPQEVGYKIAKAVSEHWDEITAPYPTSKIYKHPIKDYIDLVAKANAVPLHAGVIQYCKEAGINVPDYFIPPEYKK